MTYAQARDLPERLTAFYNALNNPPSPELPTGAEVILQAASSIATLTARAEDAPMKSRPLSEIEGAALVVGRYGLGCHILQKFPGNKWRASRYGATWPDTTTAIPISALPVTIELEKP